MARYVATHGVHFADADIQFTYDREATGASQVKVYAADLDSKKVAALKKIPADVLAQYGIEADSAASADDEGK